MVELCGKIMMRELNVNKKIEVEHKILDTNDIPTEALILLLKALDYDVKDGVIYKNGEPHLDRYTHEPVMLGLLTILPSGTEEPLIMNGDVFGMIHYFEEFKKLW